MMIPLLKERLLDVLKAVAPLIGAICIFQITFVHAPASLFVQFLAGSILAVMGMLLLFAGVELGILPMGRFIGAELPRRGSLPLIVAVGLALAFAATTAEPDVLVLSSQVEMVSQGGLSTPTLVLVIAAGAALLSAMALLRIIWGVPAARMLAVAYAAMLLLSAFAPEAFVPLAYDAGSVTTGVLSAPVLIALALGVSSVLAGRSAVGDSFGILGLGSVGPALAVLPLVVLFVVFQLSFLKLPRADLLRILTGTAIAAAGLLMFLLGVSLGFLPIGRAIGQALAGHEGTWAIVAAGALLGLVTTWGEPAVRILADQVEEASTGAIPAAMVLYAVCIGVALAVGLGMFRITSGMPLLSLLVPGYVLVLAMMAFSDSDFVAIAVDAGGVATGPLANSFLLALALGASDSMGDQDPLVQGLGLVALIAVVPVITVMALGLALRRGNRTKEGPDV